MSEDSTPTAVTVSDRMKALVDTAIGTAKLFVAEQGADDHAEMEQAQVDAKAALLREIGKLEAKVRHPSSRWNFESIDTGVRVCKGLHEKHEDCEWEYFIPCPAPADETLEDLCKRIYPPDDAPPSPPQTRGEAMPQPFVSEDMAKRIEEYAVAVAECGWEHQKEVGDADAHSATAKARLYHLMDGVARLEQDRSRLLTALEEEDGKREDLVRQVMYTRERAENAEAALEEEKQAWLELRVERDNLRLECERLTASAVLQKEALQRVRHYKGGEYTVLADQATHTETDETVVVYRGDDGAVWVRPAGMFYSIVTVNCKDQPRFAPIESPTSGA